MILDNPIRVIPPHKRTANQSLRHGILLAQFPSVSIHRVFTRDGPLPGSKLFMPMQWARFDHEIMEVGKGIAEFMFEVGVGEGVVVTVFGGVSLSGKSSMEKNTRIEEDTDCNSSS